MILVGAVIARADQMGLGVLDQKPEAPLSNQPIHRYAACVNVDAILKDLHEERELVDQAIITMERYAEKKSQKPALHGKVTSVAKQAAEESAKVGTKKTAGKENPAAPKREWG